MSWEIRQGHVLDRLREMPDESVHCCVTSPPYWGLRDYGVDGQLGLEETPEQFVAAMVEVFAEVMRVLRPDGTLWLNIGDSYATGTNADRGPTTTQGDHVPASWSNRNQSVRRHPPGLKPKDLVGIPWLLAFALRADGWYLRRDIIWCLSGGTRLYARTQKGEGPATLKDLVRLDPSTVQLWNGEKWTQVLGWSQSPGPRDGALEIELRSGERIGCTVGHLWPTVRGNVRADQLVVGDVITTVELPEPAGPRNPAYLPDEEIGWLCGRYLADGSPAGEKVQIACHQKEASELLERLAPVATDLHGAATIQDGPGHSATVVLSGPLVLATIRAYIYGAGAQTKGLTARVWQRSNAFLRALLDGYLSGDAHHDTANDRWRLGFTRNDRLAADLRTLAGRLGATLTLRATHGAGFGKTWPIYRGEIRLQRSGHHNERSRSEVVAIRRSRARQFWDIGVADEPHTFALGSGVLSHNSKPNPMPESVTDRPTSAHEYLFLLTKSPRYFYDAEAIREKAVSTTPSGNGFARPAQLSRGGRGQDERWTDVGGSRTKRSVWTISTKPFAEAHFATFPRDLVEPCIRAGTSSKVCGECGAPWRRMTEVHYENPGNRTTNGPRSIEQRHETAGFSQRLEKRVETVGFEPSCDHAGDSGRAVVLDPFSGAATTGLVATQLGRDFIGIELNPEYVELGEQRIRRWEANPAGHLKHEEPIEAQGSLLDFEAEVA